MERGNRAGRDWLGRLSVWWVFSLMSIITCKLAVRQESSTELQSVMIDWVSILINISNIYILLATATIIISSSLFLQNTFSRPSALGTSSPHLGRQMVQVLGWSTERRVSGYLQECHPDTCSPAPIKTVSPEWIVISIRLWEAELNRIVVLCSSPSEILPGISAQTQTKLPDISHLTLTFSADGPHWGLEKIFT